MAKIEPNMDRYSKHWTVQEPLSVIGPDFNPQCVSGFQMLSCRSVAANELC